MNIKWIFHGITFLATLWFCTHLKNNCGFSSVEILLISLLVSMIFILYYINQFQKTTLAKKIDTQYPFVIILGTLVSLYENFTAFDHLAR